MTGRPRRSLLASALALPLVSAVGGACSEDRSRPGGGESAHITFWPASRGSQFNAGPGT